MGRHEERLVVPLLHLFDQVLLVTSINISTIINSYCLYFYYHI